MLAEWTRAKRRIDFINLMFRRYTNLGSCLCALYDSISSAAMDPKAIKEAFPDSSSAAQLDLPIPKLELDFRMSVALNPKISLGEGPWGQRNWISFTNGQWTASWGSGTVEPGGQDSQLVNPHSLNTFVETNYLLRTADDPPAYVAVRTTGWRTGPREVLERLFDPEKANDVDASEYSFRLTIKLETGDDRYKDKLNTGTWIGSGARRGAEGKDLIQTKF